MRRGTLILVLLATGLGIGLFMVKHQVQVLEDELTGLNRQLTADRQAIHVLRAEWSHLNEPTRLKTLADRYLPMAPLTASQLSADPDLPLRVSESPAPEKPAGNFEDRIRAALGDGGPVTEKSP